MRSHRYSTIAAILAVTAFAAFGPGCAKVEMRYAMTNVQRAQRALDDRIDAKLLIEIPVRLDALEAALRDERITGSPEYREEEEFRELFDAMIAGIEEFREGIKTAKASELSPYQTTLSLACSGCHEVYRD